MRLYDTLSSTKRVFTPVDADCVKLYVCGPTVYDLAHIGNARSAVVYDMLFRLLSAIYRNVIYVRNITDVDDKIINAAASENTDIFSLSDRYIGYFHDDISSLRCISPTYEPRATKEIDVMILLISKLIDSGNAYVRNGSVYFSITSCKDYGKLSGRKTDEMISGNRVAIDADKQHPGDFVLWKPATCVDAELGSCWASPWGKGRPGWHIECSAMSYRYLGEDFDIHGGGADLMFPHHENEIAQSRCAFPGGVHARYWVHNGFLTVNGGEKMSKSLGNVITVRELINSGVAGEVIRYVFLCTHYRKPLDWNAKVVQDAQGALNRMQRACEKFSFEQLCDGLEGISVHDAVMSALLDDMNTPMAISVLHELVAKINKANDTEEKLKLAKVLNKSAKFMGITEGFGGKEYPDNTVDTKKVEELIDKRKGARKSGDFTLADELREQLLRMGIVVVDEKDGSTHWKKTN